MSKENPLNENEERKDRKGREIDQDAELPAKKRTKKGSPSATQQSFGTNSRQNSKDKVSMSNSMQRNFNRRSPVKNPRGSQNSKSPRDSGNRSSGGAGGSPFKQAKNSVVSAQPVPGDKGNFTQREKYVSGKDEIMSTQERGPVVGDHSSIYMNTEEAATRMAEDGINHNIEEQLSQRMGVSYAVTEQTRAVKLQRSMQSSMRSSKKK